MDPRHMHSSTHRYREGRKRLNLKPFAGSDATLTLVIIAFSSVNKFIVKLAIYSRTKLLLHRTTMHVVFIFHSCVYVCRCDRVCPSHSECW